MSRSHSSATTTIKVSKRLRDRISSRAGSRLQTVEQFLDHLLDDYEQRGRLVAVEQAFGAADPRTFGQWQDENRQWDAVQSASGPVT